MSTQIHSTQAILIPRPQKTSCTMSHRITTRLFTVLSTWFVIVFALVFMGCSETIEWEQYPEGGTRAIEQGHYDKAERILAAALKEVEHLAEHDPRRATTFHQLGELHRRQGHYQKAELYFWQSMPIWAETVGPDHPRMASSLTGIAQVYVAQGKFAQAEPLFKRALLIREQSLDPHHPDMAMGLEDYAALLRQTNRPDQATKLDQRRIRIQGYIP